MRPRRLLGTGPDPSRGPSERPATSDTSDSNSSDVSRTSSPVLTDDSYTDGDTSITISKVVTGSGDDQVTYFVADVVLDDATQLRSAFAQNAFGTNIVEYTSDIAADNDAILAACSSSPTAAAPASGPHYASLFRAAAAFGATVLIDLSTTARVRH